jgi:general secretion pathway protein K
MAHERGIALLTVLFILALMSTFAVYVIDDEFLMLRRAENVYHGEQVWQMAIGSEMWAERVLARDAQESETDHLNEDWHRLGPPVTVEQGTMSTSIVDLQGRFNLNNLHAGRDEVWYPAFRRLLLALEIDDNLADAVVDWLDADENVSGTAGMEDNGYLLLEPPYRAANGLFSDPGELLLVAGFDEQIVARLAPYVAALPATGLRINVNTCEPTVLRVLGTAPLPMTAAEAIAAARGDAGFASLDEFLKLTELAGQGDVAGKLAAVSSEFFGVFSAAKYGRVELGLTTVIQRNSQSGDTARLARKRMLL